MKNLARMSTSSRTLQTFTQQETITNCLLFILPSIYLHSYLRTCLHSQSHHVLTNGYSIYWPTKSLTRVFEFSTDQHYHLTLKMASAQVVETSVNNNSPSQDSYHADDLFQSRYATPGFKPFSYLRINVLDVLDPKWMFFLQPFFFSWIGQI